MKYEAKEVQQDNLAENWIKYAQRSIIPGSFLNLYLDFKGNNLIFIAAYKQLPWNRKYIRDAT
ncbi:hypothetical protein P0M11_12505 [Kaistella sp. PBT33-4]|uniref:hypothetical protein n=1 Tax=Kaistella sp. PBT33-4 TaxID=3032000 RepID=UPI0023D80016|nr:hypothetical protein [Kaistella sp. PBT33-4]MDF0720821.1 hypothetical protein [Kaistella sp. PBT33-4]